MSDKLKVNFISEKYSPTFAHDGDAGADIKTTEEYCLNPLDFKIFQTGLKVNIPYGYVGYIMSRSGLASKHGVIVLNSPGVIDHGYQGEIKVTLINLSQNPYTVKEGDRIAQLVVQKIELPNYTQTDIFDELVFNDRKANGHGSTGN